MSDFKTVEGDSDIVAKDSLYESQKQDVSKMRASLMAYSNGEITAKEAMHNITVMRVYHQISRIIRYLDQMDKLEDRLYEAIDSTLDNMHRMDLSTVTVLLNLQTRLQQNMIESHKLLQPYLDVQAYTFVQDVQTSDDSDPAARLMPQEDRNRLRANAQAVLMELDRGGSTDDGSESRDS